MIQVSNLSRYYGGFPALSDVSFTVNEGEIIGLLGLNGAGKTTTLMVLAGLMPPSAGTVFIDGTNIATASDTFRASIGYLPENPPLYGEMTVRSFLTFVGRIKGMSREQVQARLPQVIEQTQLTNHANQTIDTLSHGFRKRVGIAQAIIHDPSLVILDEPISGLDPVQIVEMRKVIHNLRAGRAVLVSSHILSEISQTCDRILVLQDGKLIAEGTEEALAARVDRSRILMTVRGVASEFEAWLNTRPEVSEVTSRGATELFTTALVTLNGDHREQLIAACITAGFGIRFIEAPRDDLEEIFIGLTQQGVAA